MPESIRFGNVSVNNRKVGHLDNQLREARKLRQIILDHFKRWTINLKSEGYHPDPRERNPDRAPNKILEVTSHSCNGDDFKIVLAYMMPATTEPLMSFLITDGRQYKLDDIKMDPDDVAESLVTSTIIALVSDYPQVNLHKLK